MTAASSRRAAVRLLCAAVLAAGTVPPAAAQPTGSPLPAVPTRTGTDCFRAVLHRAKVEPIPEEQVVHENDFSGVILVVTGTVFDYRPHGHVPGFMFHTVVAQVVRDGGAVLVAVSSKDDIRLAPGVRIERLGFEVRAGGDRLVPLGPDRRPGTPPPGPEWDLFAGLRAVRSRHPDVLLTPAGVEIPWSPLAGLPPGSRFGGDRRFTPVDPRQYPVAVGWSGPDFRPIRFLMLGDPSILSNESLIDGTSDNLELVKRVVPYLQDPAGKNRTRCIYIENGQYVSRFNTLWDVIPKPRAPVPQPNLDRLQEWVVDQGNMMVDRVQQKNVLNNQLLGSPADPGGQNRKLREILAGLFVLGSIWAAVWALRRVWKARHAADGPALPASVGKPRTGPAGIFDRRQKELLRRNNVYEPVRDLIRDLFVAAGAPHDPGPRPPRVVFAEAPGRQADRLRKVVDELWRVAFGRPQTVTVQRWQELEPQLELLRTALQDGVWRFAGVPGVRV